MVELTPATPLEAMEPITIGTVTLAEAQPERITALSPFKGKAQTLANWLKKTHALDLPDAGRRVANDTAQALWFGKDQVLFMGPVPDASLSKHVAMTDQSDAWAIVTLTGGDVEATLARLVPVDLRLSAFSVDQTARTLIGHMQGSVTRVGEDQVMLMVFRSMAGTLKHELMRAMQGVVDIG